MRINQLFSSVLLVCILISYSDKISAQARKEKSPRIVNIVNFIRELEPRSEAITEDVLRVTVENQINQLNEYGLPATFLLQYDALIDPRYQELLKNKLNDISEIGGWWEITQPHAEAAGLTWRGRYPWDWHANVGFSTGYTPAEREKLVDVYMEKFKSIFGYYPASVGSWFIDAHTLAYMYDKYHIKASCNCKDQYGTDGYTLWGGYWNQAYYPSRVNAYMPAQSEEQQIDVPIFRMLGSDPIYQYDLGLGSTIQGVASLEPVYPESGGSRQWVEWFFHSMFDEPCLAFNYAQAGQENSFTWEAMREGLSFQIPMLDSLHKAQKVRIETLRESAEWFKSHYSVTPPTAITALSDFRGDRKTVWYNSRFYRANLLWEGDSFRFRDIHLFDGRFESDYLKTNGTSTQCIYTTLPLVDGFLWSTSEELAGLRIRKPLPDGTYHDLALKKPQVEELDQQTLRVTTSDDEMTFEILFREDRIEVACVAGADKNDWELQLNVASGKSLPFQEIDTKTITANERGFEYTVKCLQGKFSQTLPELPLRLIPEQNRIIIDCHTIQ